MHKYPGLDGEPMEPLRADEPLDRLGVEWRARYLRRRKTQEVMSRISAWWWRRRMRKIVARAFYGDTL